MMKKFLEVIYEYVKARPANSCYIDFKENSMTNQPEEDTENEEDTTIEEDEEDDEVVSEDDEDEPDENLDESGRPRVDPRR